MAGSFAQEILAQLQPMLYADAEHGNALVIYVGSMGDLLFQEVEDYASDDPVTDAIGWSALVDVERVPDKGLDWLAQFVGISLTAGIPTADRRQQLRDLPNWRRGTVDALRNAPKPYLTGNKTVIFRERWNVSDPGPDYPGYLTVITYTPETVDALAVAAALISQKPAGIILDYEVLNGQDYQSLRTNNASYTAVRNNYATYNGVLLDTPGV